MSGLTDGVQASPGASDTIDDPNRLADEGLPHLEGLFEAPHSGEGGGVEAVYHLSHLQG